MVRRLLLLSLTLILSLNAFSQTVTEIKDTTGIYLSTDVGRLVVVDLVEGDLAAEEVSLLTEEVKELKHHITLQDSLRIIRDNQIASLEKIVELQSLQTQQNQEDFQSLNKEIRKQVALKAVFETTTAVSVIALVVVSIFGGK